MSQHNPGLDLPLLIRLLLSELIYGRERDRMSLLIKDNPYSGSCGVTPGKLNAPQRPGFPEVQELRTTCERQSPRLEHLQF